MVPETGAPPIAVADEDVATSGDIAQVDQDQPYERVAEHRSELDVTRWPRTSPAPRRCTEGRHRKFTPAVVSYRLSAWDGDRALVDPYLVGACQKHRRALSREIEARRQRFARGGVEARAELVVE